MTGIYNSKECVKVRKGGVRGLTEQYSVVFEYKNDGGFWEKCESEIYHTFSKGKHKEVELRFMRDMGKGNLEFKVLQVRYH